MAYVVTQNCCNDASCVAACPVGCIHPTPDEPGFGTAEMLYIDSATCIDCGACADACPVDAIVPDTEFTADYSAMNALYYQTNPMTPTWQYRTSTSLVTTDRPGLRVAIVGSGPAAQYAAKELLAQPGVEVHMFERLPVPFGLIRHGVAPDHPATKAVADQFAWTRDQERRFHLHLNVEIGTHLDHAELLAHHHAVLYAYGAASNRRLEVRGERLPGSLSAFDFVGWYNGHPDHADALPDLSGPRAIVVGNGNVALDVARILATEPERLSTTDIADHAYARLRRSRIEEVVVLGRRGPVEAAFTTPELHALAQRPDIDVIVDPADLEGVAEPTDPIVRQKLDLLTGLARAGRTRGNRRIVLRFHTSVREVVGEHCVTDVHVVRHGLPEVIETSLLIGSIGFRGTPIRGVPFDAANGTIPHDRGRVIHPTTGLPATGVYAAGWIKRGPTGVIGTNRTCANETVAALIEDYLEGRLADPPAGRSELVQLLHRRRPAALDRDGWAAIDAAERSAGIADGRPRRKFYRTEDMLSAARPPRRLLRLLTS